jgi:predicted ribosome quality control (RQC) complex YloA/Tae2 family protein
LDNLVLIGVARALRRTLRQAVVREVRGESRHRFRIIFDSAGGVASVVISLKPELPWIGRPTGRWEGPKPAVTPFLSALSQALRGALLVDLEKPRADRHLTMRFADGRALVAELATHGANLVLLDGEGRTVASAKRPKSALARLEAGQPYSPPAPPRGLLNPFEASAGAIDELIGRESSLETEPFEILRRRLFGLGTQAARLVSEESRLSGAAIGHVLAGRLAAVVRGDAEPVIQAAGDPAKGASRGDLELETTLLLPWRPEHPPPGSEFFVRSDPAATAGLYHEAVERTGLLLDRARGLLAILGREVQRLERAGTKASLDLELFENPDRYRRWGEALLAGLSHARRIGEAVIVPDPYSSEGEETAVPVRPGQSLQKAAEEHFQRHRRASRGLEQARKRVEWLASRGERLGRLMDGHAGARDLEAIQRLERAMRDEGLAVALEPATRAGRAAARQIRPRLEGVRLYTSSDGIQILVGRTGKQNHRLTFKLAAPEDFWFHALGCPGAHVVARNDERRRRPPKATLEEAAAVAAWYSEARDSAQADVQWTRRKYVRRPRGARAGAVLIKRFETVRVKPGLPPSSEPWS